jgi:4-carboxymuconolactone decarboxylase
MADGSDGAAGTERYQAGLAVRRAVLGAEYVDRVLAEADDFSRPLQELVTTYCWGEAWRSDILPRKMRSLLSIVMMVALNRPHELRLHVGGALRNGCTTEEIREALIQATIYCGVPAGVDAFRIARDVIVEASARSPRRAEGPPIT